MDTNTVSFDIYTERLSVTLFIATVVHLIAIYGVSFVLPKSSKPLNTTMEVILVPTRSEQTPKDADYLAQANQQGGGNISPAERPTTLTDAPFPELNTQLAVTPPPQQVIAATPQEQEVEWFATEQVSKQAVPQWHEETPLEDNTQPGNESQTMITEQVVNENTLLINAHIAKLASLQAELDEKFNAYAKRLRRKHIYANTKEDKYARYMALWRQKVQEVGNANYPDKARQEKLSGNLVLDVAINPDGTIREVKVIKPSKYKLLDEAAIRIVHLAAPFDSFSPEIRQEIDILHITRTWEFSYDTFSSPKISLTNAKKK
jgi:protein TonB